MSATRDVTSWITGLMRENYEAVGFVPATTVRWRYVAQGQYILQCDERGRPVGYLLHGPLVQHGIGVITQHVIQDERRLHGYGETAIQAFLSRAQQAGVDTIRLRCAADLPSQHFWQQQGFQTYQVVPGGATRQRLILKMAYHNRLPLFGALPDEDSKAPRTKRGTII